jgi:hypothetical protein
MPSRADEPNGDVNFYFKYFFSTINFFILGDYQRNPRVEFVPKGSEEKLK